MIQTEVYYTTNETSQHQAGCFTKDDSLREKGVDDQKMPKLGTLFFNVAYDGPKSALMVSILKMTDLPASNTAGATQRSVAERHQHLPAASRLHLSNTQQHS